MINSITITNHVGESITLSLRNPEQSGFFIRSVEGLGPCKGTINVSEIGAVDGGVFNSARINSRNIVFNLGFLNNGDLPIEIIRHLSYRFFPLKKLIEVKVITDDRVGRTTGYVESNEPNIFSKEESTIISVICPNPFLFEEDSIQTLFSGIMPTFEFPFENPSLTESLISFGSVFIDQEQTVFYTGDAETGILMYVNFIGPVNNLSIYNITRSEAMHIDSDKLIALTGSDFIAQDELIISTTKGNKYIYLIRSGIVINILNTLGLDTDWFQIERGDNLFYYEADSGSENAQFMIEHTVVYEGI